MSMSASYQPHGWQHMEVLGLDVGRTPPIITQIDIGCSKFNCIHRDVIVCQIFYCDAGRAVFDVVAQHLEGHFDIPIRGGTSSLDGGYYNGGGSNADCELGAAHRENCEEKNAIDVW